MLQYLFTQKLVVDSYRVLLILDLSDLGLVGCGEGEGELDLAFVDQTLICEEEERDECLACDNPKLHSMLVHLHLDVWPEDRIFSELNPFDTYYLAKVGVLRDYCWRQHRYDFLTCFIIAVDISLLATSVISLVFLFAALIRWVVVRAALISPVVRERDFDFGRICCIHQASHANKSNLDVHFVL